MSQAHKARSVGRQEAIAVVSQTVRDVRGERRLDFQTVSQLALLCIGVIGGLIWLRIILKLIGANPDNDFVRLVYNGAGLFLGPFFGLVANPVAGRVVVELSSGVGMLFYALLGWLIVRVDWPPFERPTTTSTSTYDHLQR